MKRRGQQEPMQLVQGKIPRRRTRLIVVIPQRDVRANEIENAEVAKNNSIEVSNFNSKRCIDMYAISSTSVMMKLGFCLGWKGQ